MSAFDIANELTRPFRIPRKCGADGQGGRHGASQLDSTRSPLADKAPHPRPHAQDSYGTRIIPVKRKATSSTEPSCKRRTADEDAAPGPSRAKGSRDDNSESGSAKSFRKHGTHTRSYNYLTKERLDEHSGKQTYYRFAKKGLMEALLEHKMKTGRVDSHSEIGKLLELDVQPAIPEEPGPSEKTEALGERRGPRTPPGSPPPGPATPSDSPPPDSSSESKSPSFRGRSESGSEKVKKPKNENLQSKSESGAGGILEQIAKMAHVDVEHLKSCLTSEVLDTVQKMDSKILIATVSTILSTIAQSVDGKSSIDRERSVPETTNAEVTSSCVSPGAIRSSSATHPEEIEGGVSSSGVGIIETVEMDLDSNWSGSSVKATTPPPPAAPPTSETSEPYPAAPFWPPWRTPTIVDPAPPQQVQLIQTLLQALAIPKAVSLPETTALYARSSGQIPPETCHFSRTPMRLAAPPGVLLGPPPPPPPPGPEPPFHPFLRPEMCDPPVLLDRYGQPLPTPSAPTPLFAVGGFPHTSSLRLPHTALPRPPRHNRGFGYRRGFYQRDKYAGPRRPRW